jgi:hypothetical protein
MKRSDQDRLLNELFVDENVERLRAASLAVALGALRARRRRRAYVSGAAASLAVAVAVLVSTRHRASEEPLVSPPEPKANGVKIISDEQLLALFPDRTMALIGRPGEQRLLFFPGGEVRTDDRKRSVHSAFGNSTAP